ncbi:cbb3-type cytochrome c oxidase subunit I [Actomonas aquatica]|uniref:Cbb3-type cytochrome c oxidase subunit I n=1 Tax=Actomonas aquatica TaxID=2866162 RepID=A0ABZ1C4A0_9BACT|nr:cbb3-type cytochrome c oxidase subunit I [Opitutus sp. WL0086]WRQ86547.1 cbb3-type cytochrome c oxidase subunit I [Opitutus sp. WL0086]
MSASILPPPVTALPSLGPGRTRHLTAPLVTATPAPALRWLNLALGSLWLAGLLSLAVVVGRLPWLARWLDDPLFFKRCLVVHVDLALVVWFYAMAAALAAMRAPRLRDVGTAASTGLSLIGVVLMLAGAAVRGAEPILANYVPVIDHPLFLGGLALFFAGVLSFVIRGLLATGRVAAAELPGDAATGILAATVALVAAAATWISTRAALPAGLERLTHFELAHWAPGHVLQVANVCAMLAVWLWLTRRATGQAVLSARMARGLFGALVGPHLLLPLFSLHGADHRLYVESATWLMRWTIFPVVLLTLGLIVRHARRHGLARDGVGLLALRAGQMSAGLTLLGFVLGACIRSSTTLVPAHYHASLGGVTAAFMAAGYLIVAGARTDGLDLARWRRAGRQLWCFGIGQAVFALGFAFAGAHGAGRKAYASEQHVRSLSEQIGLGVMGLGGLVAAVGGIWFLVLMWRMQRSAAPRLTLPASS